PRWSRESLVIPTTAMPPPRPPPTASVWSLSSVPRASTRSTWTATCSGNRTSARSTRAPSTCPITNGATPALRSSTRTLSLCSAISKKGRSSPRSTLPRASRCGVQNVKGSTTDICSTGSDLHGLLLEAHHTTHIEGTQLTLEQAERLWAGQTVDDARADDVRELLNYREAFNLVSDYLSSGDPITEGLIREIHKRLVEGVRGGAGTPGCYRAIQNY